MTEDILRKIARKKRMIRMLALMGLLFHKSSENGRKIKYDRRTLKILLITTIVSAFMTGFGFFCMLSEARGTAVIMIIGLLVGGGLFIYSGVNLIMGFCYIRRLEIHGYEIPYKKDDYGNDLRNVPCVGRASCPEKRNQGSRILFFLYAAVFLVANFWNVRYIIYWHQLLGEIAVLLLVIMLLFDSFWGIYAVLFYRQGNIQRYRDDVEFDENRKERTPLEKGVVDGIIILGIILLIKTAVAGLSDVILHNRVSHDFRYLVMISDSIVAVLMEDGTDRTSDSYRQMSEGCYISDWDEPEDEFSREIAGYIGISDYSELEGKFYTSDGSPRIYVKIFEESVIVRMVNPLLPDLNRYESFSSGLFHVN